MEGSSLIRSTSRAITQGTPPEPMMEEEKWDNKIIRLFRVNLASIQLSQKHTFVKSIDNFLVSLGLEIYSDC
jgi:hypothetical protein